MDTFSLVGLVLIGALGSVVLGISLSITFQSRRRLNRHKPLSDRHAVGE